MVAHWTASPSPGKALFPFLLRTITKSPRRPSFFNDPLRPCLRHLSLLLWILPLLISLENFSTYTRRTTIPAPSLSASRLAPSQRPPSTPKHLSPLNTLNERPRTRLRQCSKCVLLSQPIPPPRSSRSRPSFLYPPSARPGVSDASSLSLLAHE
jgi:hypothetical protein